MNKKTKRISISVCLALVALFLTLFANASSQPSSSRAKSAQIYKETKEAKPIKKQKFKESKIQYLREDFSQTTSDEAKKILIEANDNFDLNIIVGDQKPYFGIDLFEKTISFTNENFKEISVPKYLYELSYAKVNIKFDCGELETSPNLICDTGDRFPPYGHYVIAEVSDTDGKQKVIRPVVLRNEEVEELSKDINGKIVPGQEIHPLGYTFWSDDA